MDALSIGELSRRTGVPVATLRSWEIRYGQPKALPRSGGHRRYDESAVGVVDGILQRRAGGLTLEAAVAAVRTPEGTDPSVFATVRDGHPEVQLRRMSKRMLLSLTRAVEDEYVVRAQRALLFGSFQRSTFFAQSAHRWHELAGIADTAVVFADFDDGELRAQDPETDLVRVGIAPTSPLHREWFLVCDSDDFAVAVAGRELLGGHKQVDSDRQFETWWSLDPRVVRTAARTCAARVTRQDPATASRLRAPLRRLHDDPPPASPDLRRATSLFERALGYADDRS